MEQEVDEEIKLLILEYLNDYDDKCQNLQSRKFKDIQFYSNYLITKVTGADAPHGYIFTIFEKKYLNDFCIFFSSDTGEFKRVKRTSFGL